MCLYGMAQLDFLSHLFSLASQVFSFLVCVQREADEEEEAIDEKRHRNEEGGGGEAGPFSMSSGHQVTSNVLSTAGEI